MSGAQGAGLVLAIRTVRDAVTNLGIRGTLRRALAFKKVLFLGNQKSLLLLISGVALAD